LLVLNTAESPLYFSRHLSQCGSALGFASFQILDQNHQNVNNSGCSDDIGPLKESEIAGQVTDSRFWVLLKSKEIYGVEMIVKSPAKEGTYRLKAELFPASLTDQQREILSNQHVRILQCRSAAPIVTIVVK
jgi:hypothetical protein